MLRCTVFTILLEITPMDEHVLYKKHNMYVCTKHCLWFLIHFYYTKIFLNEKCIILHFFSNMTTLIIYLDLTVNFISILKIKSPIKTDITGIVIQRGSNIPRFNISRSGIQIIIFN